LFDTALTRRNDARSALVHNAELLNVDLQSLDGVVISHLHLDHVGGGLAMRHRTFAFAAEPLEPKGISAYVPAPMNHDRAEVMVTTAPRTIAPGVAVLPPLPRMMFWLGPVAEQALVVNVRGFGLVLVSGCGHPGIERMLAVTERIIDQPIRAVVGGLHLPVHAMGTPLLLQSTLGNPNPPWRPVSERDVSDAIAEITARAPQVIALSSHDSTPWTYNAFAVAFGDRYRTLRVGDELRVSAQSVAWRPPHSPTAAPA
jgi:7,8-dihydropterin-6-yl-methyl-4-(beta-D-ribofuranosyl)aminobenzene 5'-phosphate synthase